MRARLVKFTIVAHQLSPGAKNLKEHNRAGRNWHFATGDLPMPESDG